MDLRPLNVRTIDEIDVYKLKYKMYDGRSKPPLYTGERHKLDELPNSSFEGQSCGITTAKKIKIFNNML